MSKYSYYGSGLLDSKIEAMLKLVKTEFVKVFPSDDLKALILGGGYGRGEGGVRFTDDDEFPYNDLDFFVISCNLHRHKRASYQKALTALHHRLSELCGMDIDFSPIQPIHILPRAPFWLVWYELKYGHQVVLGNPRVLDYLPRWQDDQVPVFEAIKLLLNRGVGLWKAKQTLTPTCSPAEIDFVVRNIHKAVQAIGDSLLMVSHRYHWSNLERIKRGNTEFKLLSYVDAKFISQYNQSMEFKLRPEYKSVTYNELAQEIDSLITTLLHAYYYVWSVLTGIPKIDDDNFYREVQAYSIANLDKSNVPKNLAVNMKEFRFSAFSYKIYCQYPRYRLICSLPWFLNGEVCANLDIDYMLALPPHSEYSIQQERFIKLWEKYN